MSYAAVKSSLRRRNRQRLRKKVLCTNDFDTNYPSMQAVYVEWIRCMPLSTQAQVGMRGVKKRSTIIYRLKKYRDTGIPRF